jgi:hypothetical protein
MVSRSIATRLVFLVLLSLNANSSLAQALCDERKKYKLMHNSYQCKWIYYPLKETVSGVVLKHERKVEPCGALASATITIIKTATDTIRVLDLCSENNFLKWEKVKVYVAEEPNYQVYIPFFYDVIDLTTNQHVARTNEFDEKVMRTTWGTIESE